MEALCREGLVHLFLHCATGPESLITLALWTAVTLQCVGLYLSSCTMQECDCCLECQSDEALGTGFTMQGKPAGGTPRLNKHIFFLFYVQL